MVRVRRTETFEAIQLTDTKSANEIAKLFPSREFSVKLGAGFSLKTGEDDLEKGDWALKNIEGELVMINDNDFRIQFEKVITRRRVKKEDKGGE